MIWSRERPTEPGLYLFYGAESGWPPEKFMLVEVRADWDGEVHESEYVVDKRFVGAGDLRGAWRPFDEKPP